MSIRNEENVMGSIYLCKGGRYEGRCKDVKTVKCSIFAEKAMMKQMRRRSDFDRVKAIAKAI